MENESKTWADVARELVLNPKEMGQFFDYFSEYLGERNVDYKKKFDEMEDLDKILLFVTLCKKLQDKGVPVPDVNITNSSPKSHQINKCV